MRITGIHPKVSIVIPVYNGSNYLREAIDSALAQTYKNIEILVINDGSNDGGATERIASSYGKRVRYYKKENGGVASALNLGIKMMKGEYFSWLSHDDMYEKTKIEEQISYLNKSASTEIVIACKTKVLFPSGIKKKENINVETFQYIDIFLATSAQVGVNGCSLLIPKKAFEICGDFNSRLPVTQDYDLWFRLKDKFKFVLLNKLLVISRRHPEQDSVQKHDMMLKAGDRLHYHFLRTVPYERFEKYFKENKRNILHTYENYNLYKVRGYKKTASMMLMNILRYYRENDKTSFYRVYNLEVRQKSYGVVRGAGRSYKLTDTDRKDIDQEYEKLISSGIAGFLSVHALTFSKATSQESGLTRPPLKRLYESIKRDGLYLTGEKLVRGAHRKLSRNKP